MMKKKLLFIKYLDRWIKLDKLKKNWEKLLKHYVIERSDIPSSKNGV